MRGKRDARSLGVVGLSLLVQYRLLLFERGDGALSLGDGLFGFVGCFAHTEASYLPHQDGRPCFSHLPQA